MKKPQPRKSLRTPARTLTQPDLATATGGATSVEYGTQPAPSATSVEYALML